MPLRSQIGMPPQYPKYYTYTLNKPEFSPKYEPVSVPTTPTPTTADVPFPPTYTTVTVPKISEVPAVDVPTVPTYDVYPTTVPTYDVYPTPQPEPLPLGWWWRIPPSVFSTDAEGAYNAQFGKRQVLLLA